MKKTLFVAAAFVFLLIAASFPLVSSACTDFQITASDGSVIIGRSMEFALDLKSRVLIRPRGEREEGGSPDGGAGLAWTSKYGYLAVDAFGIEGVVLDGLNEAGLSIEGLWLPETLYQKVSKRQRGRAINVARLGAWMLGCFKNVGEIREALGGVRVWAGVVPQLGAAAPVHFAVHDADGKNIVIEFIGGEIKIHDNPVGVLTNAPSFEWHLTNLRNYVNLSPDNAERLALGGASFTKTGNGSGMLGVPGDYTPPSRFVKAAMLAHFSNPPADAAGAVNLAAHVLNAMDIPRGAVRSHEKKSAVTDYTRWVVIKDLTNGVFYMRGYEGMAFRKIEMKKLTFDKSAKTRPVVIESGGPGAADITGDLLE